MNATPIHCVFNEPRTTAAHLEFLLGERSCVDPKQPCNHNRFGDLWWVTDEAAYGVELKSVSDFLGSLWSRERGDRLETQLQGCRENYDRVILGIHGVLWDNDGTVEVAGELVRRGGRWQHLEAPIATSTGHHWRSINSFLWSISHPSEGQPVDVIWRPTKEQLLNSIIDIYEWSQKDSHSTFNHERSQGRKAADPSLNTLMTAGLSKPVATALLKEHGSVTNVLNLEDGQLLQTKGLGKKMLARLRGITKEAA